MTRTRDEFGSVSADPVQVKRNALLGVALALIVAAAAAALVGSPTAGANAQSCGAGANGSQGYAYAGHQATRVSHGIRATITPTAPANVVSGHVAGWIGVGGPGQGANGQTLWLQVGVASIPDTPTMVYAEITRGGQDPVFVPLVQNVQVGESHKVAVLEMSGRPNWWRVWLDGKPATDPVLLENSTNRWRPIATGRVVERWPRGVQLVRLPLRRCRRRRCDRGLVAPVRPRLQVPGPRLRRQAPERRAGHAAHAVRWRAGTIRLRGLEPLTPRAAARAALDQVATTRIGVPTGILSRRNAAVAFETRMHPCETALPSTDGSFQPWSPTTPPPGQSDSFE